MTETKRLGPGFMQQFQRQCEVCNGAGKKMTSTCHVCSGARQVKNLDELSLSVERGIPDGHEYVKIAASKLIDTYSRNSEKLLTSLST